MNKLAKTKIVLSSFLFLVLLTSSLYFVLNEELRVDIGKTYSTFKVLEDGKWVVSGVEYTNIFDGTTKMRAKNRSFETEIGENNITTVTRIANYKEGISTIEVYTFDPISSDVELFPISHSIQVINADRPSRPYTLQYEVQKLLYSGKTKWNILSPQSFGRKMKVEWESGNYYSRIYKYKDKDEGKLTIKYKIDSDDYLKNVRLFDPPENITVTLNSPEDNYYDADGNVTFNCSANSTTLDILENISLWGNFTGTWQLNETLYGTETNLVNEVMNDNSVDTSLWSISLSGGGTNSVTEENSQYQRILQDTQLTHTYNHITTSSSIGINLGPNGEMNISVIMFEAQTSDYLAGNRRPVATTRISVGGRIVKEIIRNSETSGTGTSSWNNKEIRIKKTGTSTAEVYIDSVWSHNLTSMGNDNIVFYTKANNAVYSAGSPRARGELRIDTVNFTQVTPFANYSTITFSKIVENVTLWTCQACADGVCNFSIENRTVYLDEQNPQITLLYPTAINYTVNVSELNYTASDENPDKCWYSIDSGVTNSSPISFGTNFTNVISIDGSNTWTVYCNDTVGYENSTSITFIRDITYPLIEYSTNSDTSNSSGDFSQKDWIWINVTVTEVNVANVTFWTWTSTNASFNKTVQTNQASIYTLNQTGLSKNVYFWNVTVCDIVGQCNTTSERYYGDEVVNISVDGFWVNKDIELGGDLNLSASSTYDYVWIDVDHPSYGTNYSSGKWSTTFELLIDWFRKTLFADGTTYSELNYNSTSDYNETSFNITSHQYDEIVNVSFNISSSTNPYDIGIFKCNSSDYDRFFYGNLTGNYIWQEKLVNKGTTPYGYSKTQNITFDNKGESYLYFYLDSGAKLVNFLLNVTSTEYGFDFFENYETNNYTDTILSTAQISGGFLLPQKSNPTSFIYDTFGDASINTTKWSYTADINTPNPDPAGYDLVMTTSESSGMISIYQEVLGDIPGIPSNDIDGYVESDFYPNTTHFDLRTIDEIQFDYDFSYEAKENTINTGYVGYSDCDMNLIIYLGDQQIFKVLEEFCEYGDSNGDYCYEYGEGSTPISFHLTKQTNSSWLVQISGTEYTYSSGDDGEESQGDCGNYDIYTYWTNGTRVTTSDFCATTYTTVTNEFYVTPNYDSTKPLHVYTRSRADYEGGVYGGYGCDKIFTYSYINFVNDTRSSFSNSSYYSDSIFDSSGDITKANMSITGSERSVSDFYLYLSGDNGVNWQNVANNVDSAITNPGQHMKYRIDFNLTETGYLEKAPYVNTTTVKTAKSNLSDIYFDVGDDGTWEQSITGDFDSNNGTIQINLSNASLLNAFSGTPVVGQTYYVPVVVNSSQAGQLNIEWINLTYDPNPVYLTVSYIQDFLTNFGSLVTNFSIDVASYGLNAIINISDLKFDYAGGNKTYTVTAHNNDSSESLSRNLTFYYSYWDYAWVPEDVEWIFFNPTSPTTKNLKVYGQTDSTPILNITNYGYGLYDYLRDSIAHYIFNDNNQTLVNDSIGSNDGTWNGYTFNNGEVTGATLNSTGKYGKAYDFDGDNDWITIPSSDNLKINITNETTFSAWIYPTVGSGEADIFYSRSNGQFELNYDYTNNRFKILWVNSTGALKAVTAGNSYDENKWYYVTVVYNFNSGTSYFYINGSLDRSFGTTQGIRSGTGNNYIGINEGFTRDFNGTIDEVRIWNRALNQTEIQQEMNNANPVNGDGLVSSWSFEQNNATHTMDTNNLVAGKVGQAARFAGNDYIEVNSFNDVSSGKISAFVWVKKGVDGQGNILSHYDHGNNQRSWKFNSGSYPSNYDDKIRFYISEDGTSTTKEWKTNDAILADDEWHHIGFTWEDNNPDGILKIYIDGSEYTDLTKNPNNNVATIYQSTQKIGIGTSHYNNNIDQQFEGSIDDVRIYNVALTEEEIGYIYNSGVGNESDDYIDYKNTTLSVYLNDTLSCVNLTLSLDNNKSNGYVLNSSWQDLANMSFLGTEDVYLWADYSCSYNNWRMFNPYLSFRLSCDGCISSEEVI